MDDTDARAGGAVMTKYVYEFADGNKDMKDLLGGKGANLAEMANMGLPVPPGFTITSDACRAYLATGHVPTGMWAEVADHLRVLEMRARRSLGDVHDPLLLSVRSGGKFSMPGMMETVLDIGLNDATVAGLATRTGDERFAWDSYRRLIQMFGKTVRGIDDAAFAGVLDDLKSRRSVAADVDLSAADLRELVEAYKKVFRDHVGDDFPQAPHDQLNQAVAAVFASWNSPRAAMYRRQERIPNDLGTAVNVMMMVYGNLGSNSGTGVAFTRDPATGARGIYGDYLSNAQGEDVVAGIRNAVPLEDLATLNPSCFTQLTRHMATLEKHYRDLCDIEFTIERGKLWMLQTRVGKRTAAAAFIIATQLVDEDLIDLDEALSRVNGAQLAQLMFPSFVDSTDIPVLATGVAASPGAAVGRVTFDSARAATRAANGENVILVRRETNPDDLPGIVAAQGVLTSHGGKTSHAAVVARGMGRTCVCGADSLDIDTDGGVFRVGDQTVADGDIISIDGTTGKIYLGEVPVQDSPVVAFFETGVVTGPLVAAVQRLLSHADDKRRLGVRANADTVDDATRARRFGAAGIGLCRTEHMFLGDRRQLVEALILAEDAAERQSALDALLPLQRTDFEGILTAADGQPVTIRLIDPPLHEFLPSLEELAVRVALAEERGVDVEHDIRLLAAVRRMHEENPMLGLRGVRLGLMVPGLFAMQVRAIAEAASVVAAAGGDPRPEIMVPLVGSVGELQAVRDEALAVLAAVPGTPRTPIGTMIEVPRAAMTAGRIARVAEFFSFGTNDLTQMGWGFSRDDVEGAFFSRYLELGIFDRSPFESIDTEGIGRLIQIAVADGRAARDDLQIGVCGEHGGDPDSVHFFHESGFDYVSCSPFRLPVARLHAGRAAVVAAASDSR
jgi:pyruvate, orthophosphate dikinase